MNDQLQPERATSREAESRRAPSPVGLSLRRMRAEDAEACGRIGFEAHGAVAAAHGVPSEQPSVEFAVSLIRNLLTDPLSLGFVAERDGRIVGSNFLHTFPPVAVIGPLTVHSEAQGGVGRRLLETALEEARYRGIDSVRLVPIAGPPPLAGAVHDSRLRRPRAARPDARRPAGRRGRHRTGGTGH